MFFILLGAPGAGKGTQADIIVKEMSLPHVASGDLFRHALKNGTDLGKQAESYMKAGQLVPDEITIKMILERIAKDDCMSGCVFDGFPRTLEQAKALDAALEKQGKSIEKAIYIEVPESVLLDRLTGRWVCRTCQSPFHQQNQPPKKEGVCDKCEGELYQRADDKEETIKERLKVYFAQTMPLLEYYEKKGRLFKCNGNQHIDEVGKDIVKFLKGLKQKK
ncbi:MAG: adenylate kinase [Dehalococcoidia bacterium]|nr:MAG: adenylate kinase [Dehalococcoidia bacterium]